MRVSHRALGVYVPGLREFVPAKWTIPENPFLGPGMAGLRDFVPAKFTLPPQPAGIGRLADFVRAKFTLPPQPAGFGDLVATGNMYPIPMNSVISAAQSGGPMSSWASQGIDVTGLTYGLSGVGQSHGDCGCGCGGTCGGMKGLGQAMTDFGNTFSNLTSGNWSGAWTSFTTFLSDPAFGTVPIWMVLGGGLLVYAFFFSGGTHSRYQRGKRAASAATRAYA